MSWVSTFFNPSRASQLTPSNNPKSTLFSDVRDIYEDDDRITLRKERRKEYAQPMDEEEEAARAPYWHV